MPATGHTDAPALARGRYRVRQFVRGATARVDPAEQEAARRLLPPAAFDLFAALPVDAQRHSLNVLRSLQARGPVEDDLAAAALLHDVGKLAATQAGAPHGLWLRGPLVLAEAGAPHLLRRFAAADPHRRLRYAAWVHLQHPAIGAQWAAAAGCTLRTCRLIELHQAPSATLEALPPDLAADLRALQWADNRN